MIRDFQQKKRDRPIAITDIAISKVPRTKFNGFSNKHNEFIQEKHKELLTLAKKLNQSFRTNLMEVGILIDIHSWEYWIINGKEPREVKMEDNMLAYAKLKRSYKNQLMFMHNHPSTGTFSGVDLFTFCKYDSLYIITAIGNDGCVYSLTKKNTFEKDRVTSEYTRLIKLYINYPNNGTMAMREILNNASKLGLEYKKGRCKQ